MRIDCAVSLGKGRYRNQDIESILRAMDANAIDRCFLYPVEEYIAVENAKGNELIHTAIKSHPDRFFGYAVANPWFGKKAVDCLEKAFDLGFHGAYFVSSLQGFSINDPIIDPLIEACEKHKRPVYFHTGTPAFALPLQLAYLARRFTSVNFIMGHCGANDFVYDIDASMYKTDNIYLETSLCYCETISSVVNKYPDRVVFGSDSPRSPQHFELDKALSASDDPFVLKQFLGGNIRRLLEGIA